MMRATFCRKGAGALIAAAAMLTFGSAVGQTPSSVYDPIAEMRARLDKLERDNVELKAKLDARPGPYQPGGSASPDKEKIDKAIDDYMKAKDAKKKEEDKKKADKLESEGYEVGKQLDVKGTWRRNQLWFETEDKAFRVHLGGRTQVDAVWVHAPKNVQAPLGVAGIGEFDDGVNFRRARLEVDGTFWEVFDFFCEYDFLNVFRDIPGGTTPALSSTAGTIADRQNTINTPVPTDLWITWTKLPGIGNIRFGNQKPWIGFEHLTSSRYIDWMERSHAFDAFIENGNNGFTFGLSTFNTYADDRLFVGGGIYKPNFRDIFGWNVGDGEYLGAARVVYNPVYEENGRCMVHVGLGYYHSTADDGVIRYRARTLLRNGNALLHNTVAIIQLQGHDMDVIVPEFAMNYGPLNVSAEYYGSWVNQRTGEAFQNVGNQTGAVLPAGGRGSLFYQGAYVTVGYFLTGENRSYNNKTKAWDSQHVNELAYLVDGDEGVCFGRGAWEVLARYSWLDLNDKGVNGGVIHSATAGVNWFLNPNAKLQFNYEIGYRDATQYAAGGVLAANGFAVRDGIYQAFGTRLAFDW